MSLVQDTQGRIAQVFTLDASTTLNVAATPAVGGELANSTVALRLCATADTWVVIGVGVDGSSGGFLLPAGIVEYVGVPQMPGGARVRVACRRVSIDGTLSVSEIS